MEQHKFDQPNPDELEPEPQDATDDMEHMPSSLDAGLPDFETTTRGSLEQIRAMQQEVEQLMTEIKALLDGKQYTDESLPGLLSRARILVDFSLPNTVNQFKQEELRLAGKNFNLAQKLGLFVLGIVRGGTALDYFTKAIKNESTRRQIVESVEEFTKATERLNEFLNGLEFTYKNADGRTIEEKIEELRDLINTLDAEINRANYPVNLKEVPAAIKKAAALGGGEVQLMGDYVPGLKVMKKVADEQLKRYQNKV